MTAYTTSIAGNVQIGTGDNINPPDKGNVIVQQSVPVAVGGAAVLSTLFRTPANCRITDVWLDAGPVQSTAGTCQLYYDVVSPAGQAWVLAATPTVSTTSTRTILSVPTGIVFPVQLNTGANMFWRFDTLNVTSAVAQLCIRYHLLTP